MDADDEDAIVVRDVSAPTVVSFFEADPAVGLAGKSPSNLSIFDRSEDNLYRSSPVTLD